MRQATKAAVDALRAEYRPIYQATYGEYQEARSQLLGRQQGEQDQLKALWAARHEDRRQALQQLRGEREGSREPDQQRQTSRAMKPPSEGRSTSPALPDSALAALRKASAAVDRAQQREAKQTQNVDLQQGRGRTRKLE